MIGLRLRLALRRRIRTVGTASVNVEPAIHAPAKTNGLCWGRGNIEHVHFRNDFALRHRKPGAILEATGAHAESFLRSLIEGLATELSNQFPGLIPTNAADGSDLRRVVATCGDRFRIDCRASRQGWLR